MLFRTVTAFILLILSTPSWAFAVLTSIKPIQMITYEITQGVTEPEVLLGNNASPHDYALRSSDVKRIHDADVVIWFGDDLEPFLNKILMSHRQVITLSQSPALVLRAYGEEHHQEDDGHHHHGTHDPHFWLGTEQARQAATEIASRLAELDPAHAAQYQANLKRFNEQLDTTRQAIAGQLDGVKNKPYYVFHDAYDYFEREYGLNNQGHFTVSPDRKPGAKTLIAIRKSLTDQQSVCVFAEPQFQPAVIESVIRGSRASVGVLDPLDSEIPVKPGSYFAFLHQLSDSFYTCLSHT